MVKLEKVIKSFSFIGSYLLLLSIFLLSSCVSMGARYSATQRIVTITHDNLKAKDFAKYTPLAITKNVEENESNILVKILIERSKNSITVSGSDILKTDVTGVENSKKIVFTPGPDANIILNGISSTKNKIEITCLSGYLSNNNKTYRGTFLLYLSAGELLLVNQVMLEQYLYGVLPCEVSPNWEKEALKAQAVAARTFAIYNRLNNKTPEYDLEAGVASQVYKGFDIEAAPTNNAINETTGEILAYEDTIIQAFFHSNSGGKTASSAEVWGGDYKYLQSIDDPYSASSKGYKWKYEISSDKLSALMLKSKFTIGSVEEISIIDRTESNRVNTLKLKGTTGDIIIKGKDLRALIGNEQIKSTNFTVSSISGGFTFEGFGWGHGVGLSQEGAREMANLGRTYKEILRHYYKDTKIKKVKISE